MKYLFTLLIFAFFSPELFSASIPNIECGGLPGCDSGDNETTIYTIIGNTIALLIRYVAVFAVFAVIYGGILFLVSAGNEERVKKAKTVIIWALVGTFLSVSAYALITIINRIVI